MMNLERKALIVGFAVWIGSITLFISVVILISSQSLIASKNQEKILVKKTEQVTNKKKSSITIRKIELSTTKKKKVNKKIVQPKEKNKKEAVAEAPLWAVQISSYTKKNYAEALINMLKKNNYSTLLYTQKKKNVLIYAVRLKPYLTSKEKAKEQAAEIKEKFNLIPMIIYIGNSIN